MERSRLPEAAWNIFSLQGSHGKNSIPDQHVNWSHRNQELLSRWCDRSSNCDRPRTYDKFYAKTPGNFHEGGGHGHGHGGGPHTDSAVSLCSSEEEEKGVHRKVQRRRSKGQRRELQYSRTLTERDVQHLERHLSMKKTIRKKIMRDLQQAFVDLDPQQFSKAEESSSPIEDEKNNKLNLNVLNFDPKQHHKSEQRFLDLLRDSSDDSGMGGSPRMGRAANAAAASAANGGGGGGGRHKFHSVRARPKPKYPFLSDSSDHSEGNSFEAIHHASASASAFAGKATKADEKDGLVEETEKMEIAKKSKRSFWQILTGRNKKEKKRK